MIGTDILQVLGGVFIFVIFFAIIWGVAWIIASIEKLNEKMEDLKCQKKNKT